MARELLGKKAVSRKVINGVFQIFLAALKRDVKMVHRAKTVVDKETHVCYVGGWSRNRKTIYVTNSDPNSMISTLIHELSHCVFYRAKEMTIEKIEELLCGLFSEKQKQMLARYIPPQITVETAELDINPR